MVMKVNVDYRFRDWCKRNNIEYVDLEAWTRWKKEEKIDENSKCN